jgi:hypothetical protein
VIQRVDRPLDARNGLVENGKWIRREQWVLHDKLMVVLDHDDVRLMVKNKLAGYDPVEVVRQNIEDFRLGCKLLSLSVE